MKRQKRAIGISLVELLVTVGLIAALLALLFPALAKMQQGSGNTRCIANLRQIGQGFRLYIDEHNGFAPPHWGEAFFDPADGSRTWLWTGHIAPYLSVTDNIATASLSRIFDCPIDPDSKMRPKWRGFASTGDNWMISYGYSYPYLTSQRNWWRLTADGLPNLRGLRNMASLILVADSIPLSEGGEHIALIDPSTMSVNSKVGPGLRHKGRFNAVLLDGHVESLGKEILNDQNYWRPMR